MAVLSPIEPGNSSKTTPPPIRRILSTVRVSSASSRCLTSSITNLLLGHGVSNPLSFVAHVACNHHAHELGRWTAPKVSIFKIQPEGLRNRSGETPTLRGEK